MKPQPVIEASQNRNVFQSEQVKRQDDVTNSVDRYYEYAQPASYHLVGNKNLQITNPFGTPCQVALLFAHVNDSTGLLALTFDNNDTSTLTETTSIAGFPGLLFSQTTSPITPDLHWIDFAQFVLVRASGITTFTDFCVLFRRERDQFIPRNLTALNGLGA